MVSFPGQPWLELTVEQRKAAQHLGHCQGTWNHGLAEHDAAKEIQLIWRTNRRGSYSQLSPPLPGS